MSAERGDTRRRPALASVAALNGLAAWTGAVGLCAGWLDFGPHLNARLPFDSLVLAALALAVVVAVPSTVLAIAAWRAWPRTDDIALASGLLLIGWIALQLIVLQAFSPFQVAYLAVGWGLVRASGRGRLRPAVQGAVRVGVGALFVAAGVGLLPHLVKNGLSVASVAAMASLAGGIVVVASGARILGNGRRRRNKVAVGIGSVAAVLAVAWVVAPAVAATNVPATAIGDTPADLGLRFEDVRVRTADDLELAGWYIRRTGGSAIVLLHGAGSTRSDVLDEAAVLADHGYSVLMIDARGHGDSDGTAMDFGWFGDIDVAAAVTFVAAQPEVDDDRIGLVGLSMGGEEAIGAAAVDARVSAVVAEGATARNADDEAWLSEVYGWRGALQEVFEHVQDAVTDLFTEAAVPMVLREAVGAAEHASFLLITAGSEPDELHAASFIRSAAPDRVDIWTVEGASHADGLSEDPDAWEERVVEFLDRHLTG